MWWPAIGCRHVGTLCSCFFNNVPFLSSFITLMPSVNGFAELPATLVSQFGCHIGINYKQVGFELYIYIYIYNFIYKYIYTCIYYI